MVSKHDRKAALILLGLAAVGLCVRLVVGGGVAPGAVLYRATNSDTTMRDSLAAQASRLARPLVRGERIDVDRASATELSRLPRIGPGLAARIVADREANGPFGSLRGLDRVSGIGETVLDAVAPHAGFSGQLRRQMGRSDEAKVRLNVATAEQLASLPGIGVVLAKAIVEDRSAHGRYRTVHDLARVRGIGAATVERLRPLVVVP
jgi:competence ComEA-like helix-hairpin-helix protein